MALSLATGLVLVLLGGHDFLGLSDRVERLEEKIERLSTELAEVRAEARSINHDLLGLNQEQDRPLAQAAPKMPTDLAHVDEFPATVQAKGAIEINDQPVTVDVPVVMKKRKVIRTVTRCGPEGCYDVQVEEEVPVASSTATPEVIDDPFVDDTAYVEDDFDLVEVGYRQTFRSVSRHQGAKGGGGGGPLRALGRAIFGPKEGRGSRGGGCCGG
jgi:hypothetical protein